MENPFYIFIHPKVIEDNKTHFVDSALELIIIQIK